MSGRFGFTILGSGSDGNATVIHSPDGCILLDAGFSTKELCRRMEAMDIDPCVIRAVLITHEHSDHSKGCRVFADKFDIPAYLTPNTCRELGKKNLLPKKKCLITAGSPFTLCGVRTEPFSIAHDVEAIAYVFSYDGQKLGFATDLGHINLLVTQKLKGCHAIVIEANHDMTMLRNSARPLHLKRRIMGRHGHLSNDSTLEALSELLTEDTRELIFAHLSRECNSIELLEELARERLVNLCRSDILFKIAVQAFPLDTVWI